MPASMSCRKCGRKARPGKFHCARCEPKSIGKWTSNPVYARTRRAAIDREVSCWLCGSARLLQGERWTADHVRPRSLGGGDHLGNLRRAHSTCNERRGDRVADADLLADLRRRRLMDEFSEA